MKQTAIVVLSAVLVASLSLSSGAKEPKKEQVRFYRPDYEGADLDIPGYEPVSKLMAVAAVDTYCIVWYDFELMDWQGWTRADNTAPEDTFFHVDDFAGLGGGTYGRLVPIEGTKSVWCGVRPGGEPSIYTCSWESAPGYGNNWDEYLACSIPHEGALYVSYHLVCDTESGADLVTFDHSTDIGFPWGCCPDCNWNTHAVYSGVVDTVVIHEFFSPRGGSKLRFHFQSDGALSDQDGGIDTDGACIIDSITIWDESGPIDYEDFEYYDVGESYAGIWTACVRDAYGTFSGLASGLESKDPCGLNSSAIIAFFNSSPYPSEDYPGLFVTPFCTGAGGIESPCQDEMVVSPPIDLTRYSTGRDEVQNAAIPPGELASLGGVLLRYNAYVDLPINNLVFRTWKMRNIENGCPSLWQTTGLWLPYEPNRVWYFDSEDLSFFITSDTIQVALGVVDMCSEWYGPYGNCDEHTPAPWYDNVRIQRYYTGGPQWSIRRIDMFQDKFPSTEDLESWVRADMANDIAPADDLDRIDPGDSAVVRVAAPFAGGLDTLAAGEARVYCHVNVSFLGPDGKPDLYGPQLEGTYGSYVSDDGDWTILLCEPARSSSGSIAPDRYCVDLNDSLFTRGYMIEYYFKAYALGGGSSTYPPNAESIPPSPYFGSSNLLEFTCLPTLRDVPGILYVDDFDGRGTFEGTVQVYFDRTFYYLLSIDSEVPDRYDVNGPSSRVSNGIGAYTSAAEYFSIFCTAYEMVIFDSGDLGICTISEGTEHSDKSNDAQLLVDWAENSDHKVGLLVMGDQVASDLAGSGSPAALALAEVICGVSLEDDSYYRMTGGIGGGGIVSPIVTGVPGEPFAGLDYYAFGGCPYVNDFDVLEVTGPGQYGLQYPDYGGQQYYAGICTDELNNRSYQLRTVWVGHSFMYIRNVIPPGMLARNQFFKMVWDFFEMDYIYNVVDSELPKATGLSQNFPNPFNPSTRLKFSLKEKGHVSMRIYDVSGRLVRVLADEVREAGSYEVSWDGTNDGGRKTVSGIYFCRMEAGDYERTLKMVQLR
jgi:hypothetical protein